MLYDMNINFLGWSIKTSVTDTLALAGFLMIIVVPVIFTSVHRRVLNERLHTVVEGNKLFEKLKYDLNIKGDLTGIDRVKLYRNEHYARTVFRGAMEYNERDFVWYFNELGAKQAINATIKKCSFRILGAWLLYLFVIISATKLDIFHWIWEMRKLDSLSGIVPIWILFILFASFHGLLKWYEYKTVKRVVNDEIRKIKLEKKELVFKDFIVIFWSSISVEVFGFLLLFINIWF